MRGGYRWSVLVKPSSKLFKSRSQISLSTAAVKNLYCSETRWNVQKHELRNFSWYAHQNRHSPMQLLNFYRHPWQVCRNRRCHSQQCPPSIFQVDSNTIVLLRSRALQKICKMRTNSLWKRLTIDYRFQPRWLAAFCLLSSYMWCQLIRRQNCCALSIVSERVVKSIVIRLDHQLRILWYTCGYVGNHADLALPWISRHDSYSV